MRVQTTDFLVAGLAFVAACATASTSSSPNRRPAFQERPDSIYLTPAKLEEGSRIYHTGYCVRCHAPNGTGGMGGPNLTDKQWLQINGTYGAIVAVITNGVGLADIREESFQRPMPPRGSMEVNLTDEQIRTVAAYVWSLSNKSP